MIILERTLFGRSSWLGCRSVCRDQHYSRTRISGPIGKRNAMRTIGSLAVSALPALARARGVTPYLPLNLHVEREATAADTARHRARAVRAWMTYSTQITATAGEMTQDHPKLEGSENIDAAPCRRMCIRSSGQVVNGPLYSAAEGFNPPTLCFEARCSQRDAHGLRPRRGRWGKRPG